MQPCIEGLVMLAVKPWPQEEGNALKAPDGGIAVKHDRSAPI